MCCSCHKLVISTCTNMTLEENSVDKIAKMVNNFETLCCSTDRKSACRYINPPRTYTDFRVDEIMKPSFGRNPMYNSDYCSDSDSSSVLDYSSDNCSSCSTNDIHPNSSNDKLIRKYLLQNTICKTQTRELSANFGTDITVTGDDILRQEFGQKHGDVTSHQQRRQRRRSNICTYQPERPQMVPSLLRHVRRHLDEEGYSTDASGSDSDMPLDLSVRSRQTPLGISRDLPTPINHRELPAWVYCTRYSDRPSAGPRTRRRKPATLAQQRRSRVAFDHSQLHELNIEFQTNPYVSDERRRELAARLELAEDNIRVWFQNRRAKVKRDGTPRPLALQLTAEGLYEHRSVR